MPTHARSALEPRFDRFAATPCLAPPALALRRKIGAVKPFWQKSQEYFFAVRVTYAQNLWCGAAFPVWRTVRRYKTHSDRKSLIHMTFKVCFF